MSTRVIKTKAWSISGVPLRSLRSLTNTHTFRYDDRLYDLTASADQNDRATELLAGGVSETDFLELNLMFDLRPSVWSTFINASVAIHPDILRAKK